MAQETTDLAHQDVPSDPRYSVIPNLHMHPSIFESEVTTFDASDSQGKRVALFKSEAVAQQFVHARNQHDTLVELLQMAKSYIEADLRVHKLTGYSSLGPGHLRQVENELQRHPRSCCPATSAGSLSSLRSGSRSRTTTATSISISPRARLSRSSAGPRTLMWATTAAWTSSCPTTRLSPIGSGTICKRPQVVAFHTSGWPSN